METRMWSELLAPYALAVDELIVKFTHVQDEFRSKGKYSPIEQVLGRVKKISSILEKCDKKGIEVRTSAIEAEIEDIAGIRIICQFTDDIYTVAEMIGKRRDCEVVEIKDYIKNHKDSGYRSYHMIIHYTVETTMGAKTVNVEIQIRTLAMDFWATIEHSLQYKYKGNMPETVSQRLEKASDAIDSLDYEMGVIRDDIVDAQESFQVKANIVNEILNNIQNLYRVTNNREVRKIQDEFYRIYATDDLALMMRFARQLDAIAEEYRSQSVRDLPG